LLIEGSKKNVNVFREKRVKERRGIIETQNDTRGGASNDNDKVFRETIVRDGRAIHSDTKLYVER
jgi:hypothetical protein